MKRNFLRKENYEQKIENRNVLIADLIKVKRELIKENLAVYDENKDLRFENEEMSETLKRILSLTECNKYNNEKAILDKIKELVVDYQSQN